MSDFRNLGLSWCPAGEKITCRSPYRFIPVPCRTNALIAIGLDNGRPPYRFFRPTISRINARIAKGLEPNHQGTAALTSDPAIRLIVHQLAFLMGIISGAEEFARAPIYSDCTAECEKQSKVVVS